MLDELATLVQVVATASSFYMVATPYETIKKIHTQKSTGNVSVFPYVCMLLSSSMWLLYSILLQNFFPLIFTNVVYLTCVVGYLAVYYTNSSSKKILQRYFAVEGSFIFCVYIYAAATSTPKTKLIQTIGTIAIVCSAILVTSPLSAIVDVLKTKSVANLPRKLIAAMWLQSVAWFLTGLLRNDPYIMYPNLVNVGISTLQLMFFVVYPSTSTAISHLSSNDLDKVGLLAAEDAMDAALHATSDIK
ncbi:Aste57867_9473 [Aphanomyces stellatus]|uniref:Sugar transporter SWEET1 n=1 Tax=Aphanomyces stellatus TaxID=120398 RepID=A0A485KNA4_9STRA|nr:hypothetical protein As57867_009436 [Aphanomyces stellatus]VFT86352.1 Aste57867_9473 [Aphanomyces stellatus]